MANICNRVVNRVDINSQALVVSSRNGEPRLYRCSSNARYDSRVGQKHYDTRVSTRTATTRAATSNNLGRELRQGRGTRNTSTRRNLQRTTRRNLKTAGATNNNNQNNLLKSNNNNKNVRRMKSAPTSNFVSPHGRKDHGRFDFGLGYKPHEHFIESETYKPFAVPDRPKSTLGGTTKQYWENRKGTPYKSLLRENLSKPLNCFKPHTRKPKMNETWSSEPCHNQISKQPLPKNRRNGSVAWRETYKKLRTEKQNPPTIHARTTGIWSCASGNAVLHDRPISRGFTPGKPALVRFRSAPELSRATPLETRMANYDYFLKMPVRSGKTFN